MPYLSDPRYVWRKSSKRSIRIWTFAPEDRDESIDHFLQTFSSEFIRLLDELPKDGLIIDVRGNGGGIILAGEQLLQLLTPAVIEPERMQFINTPLNLSIVRRHSPSPFSGFDLSPWLDSMEEAVRTGATYSRAFPITPPADANEIGQRYHGPVVLITDALCYSTTDIFAAGFQDHEIGVIIGIDNNSVMHALDQKMNIESVVDRKGRSAARAARGSPSPPTRGPGGRSPGRGRRATGLPTRRSSRLRRESCASWLPPRTPAGAW